MCVDEDTSKMAADKPQSSPRRLKKVLSVLPETPDHVLLELSLTKEEKDTWGINIVGGVKSVSGNVYVKGIIANSACGIDGQLKIGDSVLEVEGVNLMNKTHDKSVDISCKCRTELNANG